MLLWKQTTFVNTLLTGTISSYVQACSVMPDSLQLPGLQPTRLLCSWDSLGKNNGVGCHFLLCGSSQPRDQTHISCISCTGKQILYHQCHLGSPFPIILWEMVFFQVLCPHYTSTTWEAQTVISPSPNLLLYIESKSGISICEQVFQDAVPKMHRRMKSQIRPRTFDSSQSCFFIVPQLQTEFLCSSARKSSTISSLCSNLCVFSPICFIYYRIPSTFRILKAC